MLYLITYITHDLQYSEILKKSYPNIIILGYGKKWNDFYDKVKGTIDFCKTKNDDDIIVFIDDFDSVVIHTDDIIEKYKSFNVPLVFSKDLNPSVVFQKYAQDSIFSTCQLLNLNSGLYIGTAKYIIEFWKDMKINEDDQTYVTKKCNELNENIIKIDIDNKIFYNYSPIDNNKIVITNNLIKINNQYPNIISCPFTYNINHILKKLGYNISNIKLKPKNNKIYIKYLLEIIVLLCIILIIYFVPNIIKKVYFSLILLFIFLQYQIYLKHVNIHIIYKILYIIIELINIYIYIILFKN